MTEYSQGQGIAWTYRKRLDGLLAGRLVRTEQGTSDSTTDVVTAPEPDLNFRPRRQLCITIAPVFPASGPQTLEPLAQRRQATLAVRLGWLILALVASALFAAPTLAAAFFGSDFLTIGSESTAYRFFFIDRLVHREPSDLWLPQGYLTSLLHRLVYSVVVPPGDLSDQLRETINRWALLSNLGVCLVAGVALFAGLVRSDLPALGKVGLVVATVGTTYCTGAGAFYLGIAPDYFLTTMALAPAITLAFVWVCWSDQASSRLSTAALLGALIGCAASNKISLLPVATLPLVLLLARNLRCPRRAVLCLVVAGAASVSSFALVHLLVYSFDVAMLARVAPRWLTFILDPGGEPQFWERFVSQLLIPYNYLHIYALLLTSILVTVAGLVWQMRPRAGALESWLVLAAIAGAAVVSLVAIVKRPAGTTALEGATIAFTLIGCLLGLGARSRLHEVGSWLVVVSVLILALTTYPFRAHLSMYTSGQSRAELIWQAHEKILAPGRLAIVVIPDNHYAFGSVEEALLKGYSTFPSWTVREGQVGLDRFAPGMTFRSEYGKPQPGDPYPSDTTIAYVDRTDLGRVIDRYPALRDAIRSLSCETMTITPSIDFTVCRTPN